MINEIIAQELSVSRVDNLKAYCDKLGCTRLLDMAHHSGGDSAVLLMADKLTGVGIYVYPGRITPIVKKLLPSADADNREFMLKLSAKLDSFTGASPVDIDERIRKNNELMAKVRRRYKGG